MNRDSLQILTLSRRDFLKLAGGAAAAAGAFGVIRALMVPVSPGKAAGAASPRGTIASSDQFQSVAAQTSVPTPWKNPGIEPVNPDLKYPADGPSQEVQQLLAENPGSQWLRVTLVDGIDWEAIDWSKSQTYQSPIWLQGITQNGTPWAVGFTPIEIVSGTTFPVPQRKCPDPDAGGNYHPTLRGDTVEIWNNGLNGLDVHGYDPVSRFIYVHQAFCVGSVNQ